MSLINTRDFPGDEVYRAAQLEHNRAVMVFNRAGLDHRNKKLDNSELRNAQARMRAADVVFEAAFQAALERARTRLQ